MRSQGKVVCVNIARNLTLLLYTQQSKNWYVRFESGSIRKERTCKTPDKEQAMKFAKKWFKEEIVPLLENNSKVKVIDFVMNKCTLLGKSKWDETTYGFSNLPPPPTKQTGVYFILHGKKIMKVGKADGVKGLYNRLSSYRGNNTSRVTGKYVDQFTVVLNEKMTTVLKNKSLSFYYYEIPKKETTLEGFKVQTCVARSFEKELSIQARLQGHPMTLSGSD
jgi:hypothetical protein